MNALNLPYHLERDYHQIKTKLGRFLEEVDYFITKKVGKAGRMLSWHLEKVATFVKSTGGGIRTNYGRQYQIGRIGGNFLIVSGDENDPRFHDAHAVEPMIKLHEKIFGDFALKSFACDRGYYSLTNQQYLEFKLDYPSKEISLSLQEFVLPKKGIMDWDMPEQGRQLYWRRSGVEAMIGHAKKGGELGRSRAHSDLGMLGSGYQAILGVNLRQFMNHQSVRFNQLIKEASDKADSQE